MRDLRRHARSRRAGFTLLELMVALFIGSIVVMAVFSVGGASSRHFQEQQRVGVTQRSVRMAMDRLRRDVARSAYMSTASSASGNVRMCRAPASPRLVQAVWFQDNDSEGMAALASVNGAANGVSADRLRLTGNFATGDGYLVRSFSGNGNQVFLQTDWLAFRRAFVVGTGASAVVDTVQFQRVFRPGRMLHIETPNGFHLFVRITGSIVNSTGTMATINISPALGADNDCIDGLGRGTLASPISEIEYFVGTPAAGSNLVPRSAGVTGQNTVLFRRELDMGDGSEIAGTRRAVLEYAVDFNLDFLIDTNLSPGTLPPNVVLQTGAVAQNTVQNATWQVRGLVAQIAARTPEQDPRFGWTPRVAGAPLNRYQVFPEQEGAARVRQLRTEIHVPNLLR